MYFQQFKIKVELILKLTLKIINFIILNSKKIKVNSHRITLGIRFMKSSSRLDQLLKQVKASTYYCQPMNFNLKFQNFEQISIKLPQSRQHQFVIKFPQIKFSFGQQILSKLNQNIAKSRKSQNGLIWTQQNNKFRHRMDNMYTYQNEKNDEDDIGVFQEANNIFCVGFIVQKQSNYQLFSKRLRAELKKCLQKKFIYQKNSKAHEQSSKLNPIDRVVYKHFRFYLVFQPLNNNSLLVYRIMYYPDAKFLIKPIKLVPAKFTANKVYEEVLSFKQKYDYGYLSLSNNVKTKQIRFLLIDKLDPELNQNPPPMIGVWIAAQKFQSKQEQKNYFWAVIMEYLRNPSLKLKLSMNFQNTGILFTIQRPQKITAYLFQIIEQSKWNFKYQSQNTFKMPEQYIFTDQQVIVQEDKQESDIQSIQNKSIMKGSNQNQIFNNYLPEANYQSTNTGGGSGISQSCDLSKSSVQNKSVKSNQEKQLEIKFLKKELEFYKNRCQMLQKMLNNPAVMQFQAMQMLNPMTNPHLAFNSMMYGFQPTGIPNQQMNYNQPVLNNQMFKNQVINGSRNLSNTQKILNESQIQEQQIQTVPQPLLVNKQLAFNKKKTYEEQRKNTPKEIQKPNLNKKQLFRNIEQQTNKVNKSASPQFPSQQDIQMSPNEKKHYFQYDYKNISFAQDNSFDNQFNSTHKFGSFEAPQSEIFGKSPDFKAIVNPSQKAQNFKNYRDQNQIDIKKQDFRKYQQFSFDKKDNDFESSKNSKNSLPNNSHQFTYQKQDLSELNDVAKKDKNFISQFQIKYGQLDRNQLKKQGSKNFKQDTHKISQRVSPKQKYDRMKQIQKQQKGSPKNLNKHQIQKQDIQRTNKSKNSQSGNQKHPRFQEKQYRKNLGFNINLRSSQQISLSNSQNDPKNTSDALNLNYRQTSKSKAGQNYIANIKNNESNIHTKQGILTKSQDPQKNQNTKSPALSRVRQPIQNSDSDSDEQLKHITMKYKK